MSLVFCLDGQILNRIDNHKIATFTRNYATTTFVFDKLWIDLEKFALFVSPDNDKYVVELGYGKELTCIIPEEVLQNAFFKVSVFADDLITSTQETVLVQPSGYSFDIDDGNMVVESNTLTTDIIHRINLEDDVCIRPGKKFERDEHPYF